MKYIAIVFMIFFAHESYALPCNGERGTYHYNSDNSLGGFKGEKTKVSSSVFIDPSSEVCGKSIINGDVKIISNSRIEDSVTIQGSHLIKASHVFGLAKLNGKTVITSSTICQSSEINGFNVSNSTYYCDTDDPAPKDPGEAGKIHLLGIDSDGDGVRDDIEIFINNSLPNTPSKDFSLERETSKTYSKIIQKKLVHKANKTLIENLDQLQTDFLSCNVMTLHDDVFVNMHNTKERLTSLFKTLGYTHGTPVKKPAEKCKTFTEFKSAIDRIP